VLHSDCNHVEVVLPPLPNYHGVNEKLSSSSKVAVLMKLPLNDQLAPDEVQSHPGIETLDGNMNAILAVIPDEMEGTRENPVEPVVVRCSALGPDEVLLRRPREKDPSLLQRLVVQMANIGLECSNR